MAFSRLLQVKSRLHLQRIGILKPTGRCYCSSSSNGEADKSSSPSKKPRLAKEQKEAAVESFVTKYMETHPGNFPNVTCVKNSVGGSWYTLKDILTNLKEKMLGKPQLMNHSTNDKSNSTVDATASDVVTTQASQDISKLGEAKGTVIISDVNKDNILSTSTSCMPGSSSSEKMLGKNQLVNQSTNGTSDSTVDATASEVGITHASQYISELGEAKSSVTNSDVNKDNILSTSTSCMLGSNSSENTIGETDVESVQTCSNTDNTELIGFESKVQSSKSFDNSSEDRVRSDNTSDSSNLVGSKNGHIKPDAISDVLSSVMDKKPKSEMLSRFGMQTVGSKTLQPETEMMTSSLTLNAGSKVCGKRPVAIADIFMKGMTDQAGGWERTGEKNDIETPNSLNETAGRGGRNSKDDIMDLMDCLKLQLKDKLVLGPNDDSVANIADQTRNKWAIGGMKPVTNSQRSDNKGRKTSRNGHTNSFKESAGNPGPGALFKLVGSTPTSKDSEGNDADIAAFDCIESKPSPEVQFPMSKLDLKKTWNTLSAEKGSHDNKVLIRFLNAHATRNEVDSIFKDCGSITKIDIHSTGHLFKMASIYFKTKEGMQNALKKTGLVVKSTSVIVEAACSTENIRNEFFIPNLIGYPEVPASLEKNVTRTVMIKQLTPDISLRDIEAALASCGSKITGFFFGSSSSVAYVELESEEAKERVLERHSICVSGKQLEIFRIDAPRTTVVRISNLVHPEVKDNFLPICQSYGQVKVVYMRSKNVVDVHFERTEWPNMLRILNGLNGLQVGGRQWIAQPAAVFPPEILHVLWKCPDQRKYLKTQIQSLLQKVVECPTAHKDGLASMTNEYYGM